jgi:hypothetical protein
MRITRRILILKYIYIAWKYFLRTLTVFIALLAFTVILIFGLAQLPFTQSYVTTAAQTYFNQRFLGELKIGHVSGFIPFSMKLEDINLLESSDNETQRDTLISIQTIELRINPLDFLRQSIGVQSLQIENPTVKLDLEDNGVVYRIERAFQRGDERGDRTPPRLENIELFAPFLSIEGGNLIIEPRQPGIPLDQRPAPIEVNNIQFSAFAELSDFQRYLDVYFLFADIPQWSEHTLQIRGQLFNDNRFLELNGFRVELGSSVVSITGEASPIDILDGNLAEQFEASTFAVNVDTAYIKGPDLAFLVKDFENFINPITFKFRAEGNFEEVSITQSRLLYGKSELEFVGDLKHVLNYEKLAYDGFLRQFRVDQNDLFRAFPQTREFAFKDWNLLTMQGRIFGDLQRTDVDLTVTTSEGGVRLEGDIQWVQHPDYQLQLTTEGLNVGQFRSLSAPESDINAVLIVHGNGFLPESAHLTASISMYNTMIGSFAFDELAIQGDYIEGNADASLNWLKNGSMLNADVVLLTNGRQELFVKGSATSFNLRELFTLEGVSPTELDVNFDVQLFAPGTDNMTGVVSLDVLEGRVNDTVIRPHQFYADYLELLSGRRVFRFTSTVADVEIRGDVLPNYLLEMVTYWMEYVSERVDEEFTFAEDVELTEDDDLFDLSVDLNINAQVKDMSLLHLYFSNLPRIQTDANLNMQVQANQNRLIINGGLDATDFVYNDIRARDMRIQFSNSLQYGRRLQDFATLNIQAQTGTFSRKELVVDGLNASLSMLNEKATFKIGSSREGEDSYRFNLAAQAELSDSSIAIVVDEFDLGSRLYGWSLDRPASARFTEDRRFHIDELRLGNAAQLIEIAGIYSSDLDDAMQYRLINVDLSQISGIIDGRSTFEGIVDGEFSSQSLLREPAITGNLFVDRFALDGRLIGDITFNSAFDPLTDRFNTQIRVFTDDEKYGEYLTANRGVGHEINVTGWFQAPDQSLALTDTLYYFDVDMAQIDGWILVPVLPFIFTEAEGVARGSGVFTGNTSDFYFNARFDVEEVEVVPQFVFTNYRLSGEITLDRYEGVFINNVAVSDRQNGSGVLNGTILFNDFQRERPFDLTLTLNRLQFLNSTFSADTPFYGTVAGTGTVALTGSNVAPFLRTIIPITTTSDSRLTIPLLAETTVEEQARFIEFVQSFDELFQTVQTEEILTEIPSVRDLTFVEIARLDLQFIAPPATTVQLLFDPLTGEVLNARGSGRIRITLDDEDFQMFGNFNVTSGEYTFVAGDIFLRRFQLRNGGTISWEGDPVNAQLNMTAAYRARPNIGTLTGSTFDQQSRIPVDLILEITGTIQSIENDFFFEFPNAVDVTQNATELALLNSEDQKLIQATSLLFTGGFIPVGTGGDGQFAELGTSLQSRAGQVGLSQLLSNQINTLLNSNLSNLDVDLNLTGFDQADLGIALRLFNDRLILRGESQFYTANETGTETLLGDLGVTYRINRNLSVEVFHRRDPTLRSIVGNQTQAESINGVGLEAQVQFNTWKELRQRWWGQLRRVFGVSDSSGNKPASN